LALLEVRNVSKIYTSGYLKTKRIPAVLDVNLHIEKGEILALVGESGSGKTTLARMILRLIKPTQGHILLDGKDIYSYPLQEYYRRVQGIFQDPYTSFNPMKTVESVLLDAIELKAGKINRNEGLKEINSVLIRIGLNPSEVLGKYPHELSGGQLQRILIARSYIVEPNLLLADEPTSMIDASTRIAVLNTLFELNEDKGTAIIFITHDLSQAFFVADKVAIMYKGRIIEFGDRDEILKHPQTDYTRKLLTSIPQLHTRWFKL